ncbi:MAG: hypothetical protein OJF49_004308 [Ktedonobacterales bacterium]|nr:MAG: hypothetical protein OJF49_004308 [Ktedonobacterales bacterium]
MVIEPTQAFLGALALAGANGARRGVYKESLTAAIVLSSVLLLSNGGDKMISNFLINTFVGLGGSTVLGGPLIASGGGAAPPAPAANTAYIQLQALQTAISRITFLGLTIAGYRAAINHGTEATTASHRIAGVIPGAINGAAIAYYITHYFSSGGPIVINTPGSATVSDYLPMVFGASLLGLLGVLFVASQMKKASANGKH